MLFVLIFYFFESLLIGAIDIYRLDTEGKYYIDFPPVRYPEPWSPKQITGVHNLFFLPSFLFIKIWVHFASKRQVESD